MADPEQEELSNLASETEDQLLETAFAPEEKTPPEEGEKPPSERPRDPETGRFAKRAETEPERPTTEIAPPAKNVEGTEPDKPDEQVPSWRLREINEEKRQAQAELERMRVEHARLQAWAEQQRRQQAPEKAPPAPDPLVDPVAYTKFVQDGLRAEFAQQQAADRLNFNLELTEARYGERFQKAFEALVVEGQRGNHQLVRQLVAQSNPGMAILRWHNNNEVLRTVGDDPAKYQQKLREDLLNDPEFLAQAAERAREVATGGGQQRPNTVVKMPPSLSKATGSAEMPSTATDGSEAALFAHALNAPSRRR